MSVIECIVFIICFAMVVAAIWSKFSKSTFWCDNLDWHLAPLEMKFDGMSFNGRCPRCGKRVLQDSQGNWFRSSRNED